MSNIKKLENQMQKSVQNYKSFETEFLKTQEKLGEMYNMALAAETKYIEALQNPKSNILVEAKNELVELIKEIIDSIKNLVNQLELFFNQTINELETAAENIGTQVALAKDNIKESFNKNILIEKTAKVIEETYKTVAFLESNLKNLENEPENIQPTLDESHDVSSFVSTISEFNKTFGEFNKIFDEFNKTFGELGNEHKTKSEAEDNFNKESDEFENTNQVKTEAEDEQMLLEEYQEEPVR